jgi:hypothetical protein
MSTEVKGNGGGGDGSKSYKGVATAMRLRRWEQELQGSEENNFVVWLQKKLKRGVLQQPLQKL